MTAPIKIILVHGTWGRGFNPCNDGPAKAEAKAVPPLWFESGSKFYDALVSGLAALAPVPKLSAFLWSGANSIEERRDAAAHLARTIDESVAESSESRHFLNCT
jgi:hypothetical protein